MASVVIPSKEVPQADRLADVASVVHAVAGGASSYQAIARAIGKVERQGRYYRLAAEILGFVQNIPGRNQAVLTQAGRFFLGAGDEDRKRMLAEAVLRSRMIQRVIPFLEANLSSGVTRQQLSNFIETVAAPTGPTLIPRRVSSIIAWLGEIGLLRQRGSRYFLEPLPQGTKFLDYKHLEEPLSPRRYELSTYQSAASRVAKVRNISVLINEVAQERATRSHQMLIDLVADRIRAVGGIPKRNRLIDLSADLFGRFYLFEMKSTTETNYHVQVRGAISQLYEYKYLQDVPSAKLVVVTENPPQRNLEWLIDYVINDRQILVAWNGDRRTLHCPPSVREQLNFLG